MKYFLMIVTLLAAGCAHDARKSQELQSKDLLTRASYIRDYPATRNRLVSALGLESIKSVHSSSDVWSRRGEGYFNESWTLPDGYEVWAYGEDPSLTIRGPDVDRALVEHTLDHDMSKPRKLFNRIIIKDGSGRSIFDSAAL